ncbi:MAG: aminoglycoside phosphotransferase family protein [Anaerolineaceae bacterium]|nr:aminoglycoside phosphotransferase family protein [Anaerolineaceae bacterium]
MLEKPAIADETIVACVQASFALAVDRLDFLPLGADLNTAVYRVTSQAQTPYFLKLRSGRFNELSVLLPKFLSDQGIAEIIRPFTTQNGELWADLGRFRAVLYPFIEGHDAYEVPLSEPQWRQFGAALQQVHTAVLPPFLAAHIAPETYSPKWRQIVADFMQRIQHEQFTEPVAVRMAAFLNTKRDVVAQLRQRTEELAEVIQKRPQTFVLCHADIHAWNVLVSTDGALYIVDWDDPVLAPKERDLMFIGAGLGNIWDTPREEALFYEGYGPAEINRDMLAYYRGERIIQDIAVYCEQIFLSDEGGQDREVAFRQLASNFLPQSTIEKALAT